MIYCNWHACNREMLFRFQCLTEPSCFDSRSLRKLCDKSQVSSVDVQLLGTSHYPQSFAREVHQRQRTTSNPLKGCTNTLSSYVHMNITFMYTLCHTILYHIILCYVILYNSILYYIILLCINIVLQVLKSLRTWHVCCSKAEKTQINKERAFIRWREGAKHSQGTGAPTLQEAWMNSSVLTVS